MTSKIGISIKESDLLIFKLSKVYFLYFNITKSHIKTAARSDINGYWLIPKIPYAQEDINPENPNPINIEKDRKVIKFIELLMFNFFKITNDIGPPRNTKNVITNIERPNIVSN